jgi:hypothetical protein
MNIYYIRVNIGPAHLLLCLAHPAKQIPFSSLALTLILVASLAAGVADTGLVTMLLHTAVVLGCLALPRIHFLDSAVGPVGSEGGRDRHVPAPTLQALRYQKPARDR